MNRSLKIISKIALGALIILILFYKIGFKEILRTIGDFDLVYILILVPLYLLSLFIGGININILIRSINEKLNFWKTLKYYIISWSFGLLVPGKLGEFSLVYFLKKEEVALGKGLVISILDKVITIIALSSLAIIGFFSFFTLVFSTT